MRSDPASTGSTVTVLPRVVFRGCNYKTEVFKAKYDLFYTVRSVVPEWFDHWDPTEEGVRTVLDSGGILPLRGYDKKGRFVMIIRQRYLDPAVMTIDQLYKTFIMLFSIAMEGNYQVSQTPFSSVCHQHYLVCYQAYCTGYVIISDQEDITIKHAMMLTPSILRKHMVVFQVWPVDYLFMLMDLPRTLTPWRTSF